MVLGHDIKLHRNVFYMPAGLYCIRFGMKARLNQFYIIQYDLVNETYVFGISSVNFFGFVSYILFC